MALLEADLRYFLLHSDNVLVLLEWLLRNLNISLQQGEYN